MPNHLVAPVQFVLLYENIPAFDAHYGALEDIDPVLKAALAEFGHFNSLYGYNGPRTLGLSGHAVNVTVDRFDAPMARKGFEAVLANPLYANGNPDLCQAIHDHQRALLIEISPGSVPGMSAALAKTKMAELLGDMVGSEVGMSDTQQGYERRLLMAQAVGIALAQRLMPTAVHWGLSDKILNGADFVECASKGFAMGLYTSPFLYGGEQTPTGEVKAGMRLAGARYMMGKDLFIEPDTQHWRITYLAMMDFVIHCRKIGRILEDHETFASENDGGRKLYVRHMNDLPELPDGYVMLSYDSTQRAKPREVEPMLAPREEENVNACRGKRNIPSERPMQASKVANLVLARALGIGRGMLRSFGVWPLMLVGLWVFGMLQSSF